MNYSVLALVVLCVVANFDNLFATAHIEIENSVPIVTTSLGRLQGKTLISRDGKNYSAFLGVRYVKQPERFEPSELVTEKWEDVHNATEFGSECPQNSLFGDHKYSGTEDCLFMNIYVPEGVTNDANSNERLPVMLFIHGGAFIAWDGGKLFGPKFFMDESVILVTFNYRLGALGFLNTEDGEVSGNMGMKDQVNALKWVHKNIENFGGDPAKVTIFGESAGAASVSYLIVSPMAKGLFRGAIAQSGSTLNPWAFIRNPAETGRKLGKATDCPIYSSKALVNCLKSKSEKEIVLGQRALIKWFRDPGCPFAPTVEIQKYGSKIKSFLPDTPINILKEGKFNRVPLIIGIMEHEGLLVHAEPILSDKNLTEEINYDWDSIAPITLGYDEDTTKTTAQQVSNVVRQFYFQEEEISTEKRWNLTNMYSDRFFNSAIKKSAKLHSKYSPVYPYIFSYFDEFSVLKSLQLPVLGASHADELFYEFNVEPLNLRKGSKSETFSKEFVKLWASFAKYGEPKQSENWKEEWKPIEKDAAEGKVPIKWFQIGSTVETITEPFTSRTDLWDILDNYISNNSK